MLLLNMSFHYLLATKEISLVVECWISAVFILKGTGHVPFPMGKTS